MTNEQLVILIQNGDNVASNMLELWEQNQGLIAKIALKYSGYEDIEDLKQQGYIGLCNAANAYKPDEGAIFSTYAVFWIQQSMHRYIEECGSIVRIPSGTKGIMTKYRRFTAAMQSKYGRNPSDYEIMLYLGINQERLRQLRQGIIFEQMKSIDVPVGEDEKCMLYDLIPSNIDVENEVLDNIQMKNLKDILWKLVEKLPEQEAYIIIERFQNRKTRKEISNETGMDLYKVKDLEYKALWKLGHGKGTRLLKSFIPEYTEEMASKAMQGIGVKRFQNTWTSATERVALSEM